MFKLHSEYKPTGDQPEAIKSLVNGLLEGKKTQVLLGATGTGKTFTISNVIASVNRPTIVLVHNKTLAGQLYNEFKELFPENRVEYFVSNFDFYQPEAYIPKSDTYIEKSAMMNMEIEMLRSAAINAALERKDTIIVASVAAIYALQDPDEYRNLVIYLRRGDTIKRKELINQLIEGQFKRNDLDLAPGTFRVSGEIIEIAPASTNEIYYRIEMFDDEIERISEVDPVTGRSIKQYQVLPIFPAYSHASRHEKVIKACEAIKEELKDRVEYYRNLDLPLEKERIETRTLHDIESLRELGMCPGIENYSMHIDGRKPGETPFTLFDYLPDDYLLVVDESHVTLPQIRGMFNGDRARKTTLVEYGFRLPSALENRPLNYQEFESKMKQAIFISATPGDYELESTDNKYVEQIIRPTGLLDPIVEVRPKEGQIDDIINEIHDRARKNERTLILTLTIRMAEDLTEYLKRAGIKVAYLHNETKTLERTQIIYELRKGKYDVLVGINLLREGLDIPEVSLISILDADKEGFLRSTRSLIQIIGRAARNSNGKVILYANEITDSMRKAIDETNRRREIQEKYNLENGIIPKTIVKPIREPIHLIENINEAGEYKNKTQKLSKKAKEKLLLDIEKEMRDAAKRLDFERAAELRDILIELKEED